MFEEILDKKEAESEIKGVDVSSIIMKYLADNNYVLVPKKEYDHLMNCMRFYEDIPDGPEAMAGNWQKLREMKAQMSDKRTKIFIKEICLDAEKDERIDPSEMYEEGN